MTTFDPAEYVRMLNLRPCASGQCRRLVSASSLYCCGPCSEAWEAAARWDIDGLHSPWCNQRAAVRGTE